MKRFLLFVALTGAVSMRDDPAIPARDRMRYSRWVRVLLRKLGTGRGTILGLSGKSA